MNFDGIWLHDKQVGWTSFDAVAKLRGQLTGQLRSSQQATGIPRAQRQKRVKVGHVGTLDPFATGLLILLSGSYTKKAGQFLKLDKTYQVQAAFGSSSSTGDPEGEIEQLGELPSVSAVGTATKKLTGEIDQTPPKTSAIKIDGQRAYQLARSGQDFEMPTRSVQIHGYKDIVFYDDKGKAVSSPDAEVSSMKFTVSVGSGTYIRSLVQDIAKNAGAHAYCTALRRLEIGHYSLADINAGHGQLYQRIDVSL